jgi:hypothetical protein
MKQLPNLSFSLAGLCIFWLCLANVASCWQSPPVSPLGPTVGRPAAPAMERGTSFPPPGLGTPLSYPSFWCGPQQYRNNPGPCFNPGCDPRFRLTAQIGYGHFGLDFAMRPPNTVYVIHDRVLGDIPSQFPTQLDLSLADANVAIGSIEARAESRSGIFLAVRLQGNAPRDLGVQTADAPLGNYKWDPLTYTMHWTQPEKWDGSNFQWWTLDNDIGYRVTPSWSLFMGLRRDQLFVGLNNPRDAAGQLVNFSFSAPPGAFSLTTILQAELSSVVWTPYLGVEMIGPRYRASLVWGPYAWTEMKVPYRLSYSIYAPPGLGDFLTQFGWTFDYRCNDLKKANLLEYNFEYDLNVGGSLAVQLWTRGNWMKLSWSGEYDELYAFYGQYSKSSSNPTIVPLMASPLHGEVDSANYTRWMISGGIGTVLFF